MFATLVVVMAMLVVCSSAVTSIAFVYCYGVAALRARGIWMPVDMRLIARLLYVLGAAADAAFNLIRGRVVFREWSQHGVMFSNRVQWHIDHSDGDRVRTALRWAHLLNAVAPDHIKRVDAALARFAGGENRNLT
jgi:hypothetical protein